MRSVSRTRSARSGVGRSVVRPRWKSLPGTARGSRCVLSSRLVIYAHGDSRTRSISLATTLEPAKPCPSAWTKPFPAEPRNPHCRSSARSDPRARSRFESCGLAELFVVTAGSCLSPRGGLAAAPQHGMAHSTSLMTTATSPYLDDDDELNINPPTPCHRRRNRAGARRGLVCKLFCSRRSFVFLCALRGEASPSSAARRCRVCGEMRKRRPTRARPCDARGASGLRTARELRALLGGPRSAFMECRPSLLAPRAFSLSPSRACGGGGAPRAATRRAHVRCRVGNRRGRRNGVY